MLQYEVGQYYGGHHDFIPAHSRLPCGPRVYTLFMYLSDVEEGAARFKVALTSSMAGAHHLPTWRL